MIELQHHNGTVQQHFGGDTLNTAVYLSRLTQKNDIQISYFSALGQDSFSHNMIAHWQQEGINTQYVVMMDDRLPGLYSIEVDPQGERSFHYWRNEAAAKFWLETASQALLDQVSQCDVLYLSGISLAILTPASRAVLFDVLAKCKSLGGRVVFDNNYRPRLWASKSDAVAAYTKMLSLTDIGLLTFDDEQALYGDTDVEQCISRSLAAGLSEVVIKRGSQDCLVVTLDGRSCIPAIPVTKVVDTTSAGDSFAAGYLSKRLFGGSVETAAKVGHLLAGTVIQHKGAIINKTVMPNLDTLVN